MTWFKIRSFFIQTMWVTDAPLPNVHLLPLHYKTEVMDRFYFIMSTSSLCVVQNICANMYANFQKLQNNIYTVYIYV